MSSLIESVYLLRSPENAKRLFRALEWSESEETKAQTIEELIKGRGKPESLKYIASDTWSRQIDLEHRLVYKVTSDRIHFLQARYHYQPED